MSEAVVRPSAVLQSVQVLRAAAALMVVVCHIFQVLMVQLGLPPDDSVLNFGVDLFFVISGFIMVHATNGRKIDGRSFLIARLTRIVPLYWLALLATLLTFALVGHRIPAIEEMVQAFLFIPYTDPVSGEFLPFLPVGWTLSYEMLFYLAFAVTITLGPIRQIIAIGVLFAGLVAARFVLHADTALIFRLTSPLFFEFSMGMVVALLLPHVSRLPRLVGIAAIAIGLAAVLVMHPIHIATGFPRFIAHGVPAALVVIGALALEPWFAGRVLRPLRFLGDASYSLYLTHPIPLVFLPALLPAAMPYWGEVAFLVGLCLVLGVVTYLTVERPLLGAMRKLTRPNPGKIARA